MKDVEVNYITGLSVSYVIFVKYHPIKYFGVERGGVGKKSLGFKNIKNASEGL